MAFEVSEDGGNMGENEDLRYIKEHLRREDLTPAQREVYDILGIQKYLELCDYFGGGNINLCKLDTLRKKIVKRCILEDKALYNSGSVRINQIANMHNVCRSTVYNILKEGKKQIDVDGQMD